MFGFCTVHGNTVQLRYRDQPVNAVWGNYSCLLRELQATHRVARGKCSSLILNKVLHNIRYANYLNVT